MLFFCQQFHKDEIQSSKREEYRGKIFYPHIGAVSCCSRILSCNIEYHSDFAVWLQADKVHTAAVIVKISGSLWRLKITFPLSQDLLSPTQSSVKLCKDALP